MTDFAVTRKLVISTTMFPHKSVIRKYGYLKATIDVRHARNIIDV
jgi:hypothetical protein